MKKYVFISSNRIPLSFLSSIKINNLLLFYSTENKLRALTIISEHY